MDLLAAILQTACYLLLALGLCVQRLRRPAAAALGAAAVCCLLLGFTGPAERQLVTTHTFVAYEGIDLEPSAVHFPTGTATAPGWAWPLPFAGFAALGIWLLRAVGRRRARNPFVLPLLFAWSATAAWLGMQALAAPAAVVQPFGLDRFLWPAALLLTLQLAAAHERFLPMLAQLSLGIVAQRLPAALFSKLASDRGLGTGLDVSSVTDIVHPVTHLQFEPRLDAGSTEQQFWLIWAEHVLAYPAFYLMSMAGIAFAAFMIRKHDRMAD